MTDFGYDPDQPLDVDITGHRVDDGAELTELTFAGARDRERATLVDPETPNGAAAVLAHGGSDDGRHLFVDEALALARHGFTVVLPATQLPLHGNWPVTERAVVRSVLIHRRVLDLLTTRPDVDPRRIGFFGHSGGAFQGAVLVGVEPRLRAAVLAAFGSGTLVRVAVQELAGTGRAPADGYLAALARFDPARFLGAPHRAELLLQFGRYDDVIAPEEVAALRAAAGPQAQVIEYPCGHDVAGDPGARADRLDFFHAALR